ncbi:hypothetical protein ASPWEDRAFT_172912 [Aspergillus wentii DTO 134E9]|uniref:Uncharacterized protein n=1 Tax=Aspergillus wentii DTO 134E9 TaxID=1073089 RepID=A0A1L9RMJ9_ASPWE|nr:uncharacterized protein ASPWEDRAFT_172912 [Aspergillus wentii DTO 134E9]KAI9929432.1 hypothetical protein MW887_000902 [Aspergillus wentii]OJJ36124.1 hypothetical protein ASPWEDRAFT_172912 [Aspergillus wentii DTO 134E9]
MDAFRLGSRPVSVGPVRHHHDFTSNFPVPAPVQNFALAYKTIHPHHVNLYLDLTGLVQKIEGRPVKIEEQLTGSISDSQSELLTTVSSLNPKWFSIEDPKENQDFAFDHFLHECDLVEIVHEIGHGPKYISHFSRKAGPKYPYPNGLVHFLIMSRVPGENVRDIFLGLSDEQLASIKRQLAYILEHMRQNGRTLYEQDPDFLRYDIPNDKLYLANFTFFNIIDPDLEDPITEQDVYVLTFKIWQRHLPRFFGDEPPRPPAPATTKDASTQTAGIF